MIPVFRPLQAVVWAVVASLAAPRALAGQGEGHLIGPTTRLRQPVSLRAVEERVRAAAAQFRAYAGLPRVVFFDVAYPQDSAEYRAMAGFALLVVTALTQKAAELPLGRVFVRSGGRDTELTSATWVRSAEASQDTLAARVFGDDREDALYLLPIATRADTGDLMVDFAATRRGFVVQQFAGLPGEVAWLPTAPPTAPRPSEGALLGMVAREYPGFLAR